MKVLFTKYTANGNDFILIQSKHLPKNKCLPPLVSKLCNRKFGIGADGLLLISKSTKYDFSIDYYNSDGSWETFCANGSRCVAKFMSNNKKKLPLTFQTSAAIHSSSIDLDGRITMSMKLPKYENKKLDVLGYSGAVVDTGARHFVMKSERLMDKAALKIGREIRWNSVFKPTGINVNLYKIKDINTVKITTYEKGIEDVMMSCSSGSAAVVFHLAQKGIIASPTTTISKGGTLSFAFDNKWGSFSCSGPANHCFSGSFSLKDFCD